MYDVIFNTPKGTIYQVDKENGFQVEFGNMILLLKFKNLINLKNFLVSTDLKKLDSLKVAPSNKIIIHPSSGAGYYAFTEAEFIEFRELVLGSISIIAMTKELEEIINTEIVWKK